MLRDTLRSVEYFESGIAFKQKAIYEDRLSIAGLPRPDGRAGRASDTWDYSVKLVIQRFSRGDALGELRYDVLQMIDLLALKQATATSPELPDHLRPMYTRLDLGMLYDSLTLLTFVVALRLPVADLCRSLALIGHAGEDVVLDHVARACGEAFREISAKPKFPKVYSGLADVVTSPPAERAAKLKHFVEVWYRKMKPIYWHDNHLAAEGAYFGYWCFEAALVSMVFSIDDSAFIDHPNYPGDLTRHYQRSR